MLDAFTLSCYLWGDCQRLECSCRLPLHSTRNRLYVHIFAWPMQALHLPGLAGRVEYAQLLHDGSEIHLQSSGHDDSLTLTLPVQRPDVLVPVLELFLG